MEQGFQRVLTEIQRLAGDQPQSVTAPPMGPSKPSAEQYQQFVGLVDKLTVYLKTNRFDRAHDVSKRLATLLKRFAA